MQATILHISGARAQPVAVVAAESVYGDIAQQIGGPFVTVTSVLTNPGQDPHLFEASPSVARRVAQARLVVLNGIGYDPWMVRLLAAAPSAARHQILVSDGTGHSLGDNPHLWYDLPSVAALGRAIAAELGQIDPAHQAAFQQRLQAFETSLEPIQARLLQLRRRTATLPVAATEPVFGYILEALAMDVRDQRFALAVMNDTEPAASDVAAFEDDLKQRRVRVLIHNSQTAGAVASRMERLARAAHIPVLGVSETEPPGQSYQRWVSATLDALERALPP